MTGNAYISKYQNAYISKYINPGVVLIAENILNLVLECYQCVFIWL